MIKDFELSDLYKFKESMSESREKELLGKLLFEYGEYTECGTVEDCKSRKEWMSYSFDDIRRNFTSIVNGLREEVDYIRADASQKKKRGRPCKKSVQEGK